MTVTGKEFNRWAAKAPLDDPGAQRLAEKLYEQVKPELTAEEQEQVATAVEAVLAGGSRGEFDRVARRIRKRLFAGKKRIERNNELTWTGRK
jgi:hypothetical protein